MPSFAYTSPAVAESDQSKKAVLKTARLGRYRDNGSWKSCKMFRVCS
jgi:hypothetical protein